MNLSIMVGALCGPADDANIRANSPDDCRSVTEVDQAPRAGGAEPNPSDDALMLEDGS